MIGIGDPTPTRREFLRTGACGAIGLSLPQLLRAEAAARPTRPRSCIFIFAWGGPSQLETFDPKPDAPAEVRGEFQSIATKMPGLRVCEHLPKLAGIADQYCVIRSVRHKNNIHNPGAYYALTGRKPSANVIEFPARRSDWPALGSILARAGSTKRTVPPYVVLPVFANDIGYPTPGQRAGFLGGNLAPLVVSADPNKADFTVPNLTPRAELGANRLDVRRDLVRQINARVEALNRSEATQRLDRYSERAYDLIGSAACKQAFDINQERATVRDRYGRTRHGQSLLLARRLVEAGVRLVLVNDAEVSGRNKIWDTHDKLFKSLKQKLPETDGGLAALLEDLRVRGMLESTLVVWMGEFGRTPQVNKAAGRDHSPSVYSVLLAGGGIKGGQVYGSSDARAEYPRQDPVGPEEVYATIYRALGLPEDTHVHDFEGRPHALYHAQPIKALF
jgi:hypothetical protein